MLPSFRFLFAAIVLSMSILVFGLGAAALLRAAHEEFASNPSWRMAPEPKFAQASDAPGPVLAMLRLEPASEEPKPSDGIAAAGGAEPPAITAVPDEPANIAALKPQDPAPAETAKPKIAVPETTVQAEAAPVEAPAPTDQAKIAAAKQVAAPASEAAAPATEQAAAPAAPETGATTTQVAALGDQSVVVEVKPPAKAVAKPDQSVVKKRLRAAQRRQAAHRARLAREAAAQQQQAADPFAQPTTNIRSR